MISSNIICTHLCMYPIASIDDDEYFIGDDAVPGYLQIT